MKKNYLAIFLASVFLTSCGLDIDGDSLLGEDFEVGKLGCDTFISGEEGELEIPPDLTSLDTSDSLVVPGSKERISVSESALNSSVLPERLDMQVRREGDVSWLAVDTEPTALWSTLIEFLERTGFQLTENNPKQGYIATHWRERKIPVSQQMDESILLRTRLYVRLERDSNAVTNVFFIAHSVQKSSGGWQLAPSEPDFEYSILSRFKTYLASQREVANIHMASIEDIKITLNITNVQDVPVLNIGQHYSKVWRRLGTALMRSGIDIKGDDRSRGLYLIKYNGPYSELVNSQNADNGTYFKIHLLPKGSGTTLITIHSIGKKSQPPSYDLAYEILKRIVMSYSPSTKLAES